MHEFRYYNASFLREVASVCLRDGERVVTDEWLAELDDISLAVWYQDDGSWGRDGPRMKNGDRGERYITFSTEGFDLKSVEKLSCWLCSRGYSAHVRKSKGKYYVISLNHSSTIRFWKTVAPYIIIGSKIDQSERPGRMTCQCGELIEPKMRSCAKCVWAKAMNGEKCNRPQLIRRFGTSSLSRIRRMKIENPIVEKYWLDLSDIGSKVRDLRL